MAELKKKEKDLQDKLAKKLEELKKICLREAVSFTAILLFPLTLTTVGWWLTLLVSLAGTNRAAA